MDWTCLIAGLITGLAGGVTLKTVIDNRNTRNITKSAAEGTTKDVAQIGNRAGGDIAGRDINKIG